MESPIKEWNGGWIGHCCIGTYFIWVLEEWIIF